MKTTLSPRELADALGVSDSSIKRWADEGLIRASRTAGGHRRISTREALRFVRETRAPLVRPDVLGLATMPALESVADDTDRLFELLKAGRGAEVRALLVGLYLGGRSVAQIVDGPLRAAMSRFGEHWRHDEMGIFWEHRATDLCIQALNHLRSLVPEVDEPRRAVGGAPAGDPYLLPSLCVATVLESVGVRSTNLGPDTPLATLERAAASLDPRLVWLSVSAPLDGEALVREVRWLLPRLEALGATLMVGGVSCPRRELAAHPNLYVGASMAELEAFVKGLSAADGR